MDDGHAGMCRAIHSCPAPEMRAPELIVRPARQSPDPKGFSHLGVAAASGSRPLENQGVPLSPRMITPICHL